MLVFSWLAQAELSTFSKSTKVVPRSIYLSHQFSFYKLGEEDYNALVQLYHFGSLNGSKIDVRKEVEVQGLGGNEDFGAMSLNRASASSFDDGLASAMVDPVMNVSSFPPVLPMLPNGHGARRFSGSIPIRPIGDGVSESLGRLRREMKKRTSAVITSPDGIPKLEFDEEDEDFVVGGMDTYEHSPASGTSGRSATVYTPDTSQEEDDGEDVQPVVDEVERFDHISAVGIMDEEREEEEKQAAKKRGGKKGKR